MGSTSSTGSPTLRCSFLLPNFLFLRRFWKATSGYALAILGVTLMTGLIAVVPGASHLANVSLLFLLVVIGVAFWCGRTPAVGASLLAVLSFDWFFVAPRHTFSVSDPAEWLALGVFLLTACVISQLTTTLHLHAHEAREREAETAALAKASWAVASKVSHHEALTEVLRQLSEVVECESAAILVPNGSGAPEIVAAFPASATNTAATAATNVSATNPLCLIVLSDAEREAVELVLQGRAFDWNKSNAKGDVCLPLALEERVLGALLLRLRPERAVSVGGRRVVEALCHHAAVALERHQLTRAQSQAQVLAEADRLKTALLSMMSHDFRSPLTSIKTGVTGLLQDGLPWDASTQRELLQGIDQETDRLNGMVGNVLALSRLEAGAWRPQCEVVSFPEVVGAALDAFSAHDNVRIRVELRGAPDEAWLDMVQIVQVLHNLLENALKYSPPASPVELRATQEGNRLCVEVSDCGTGLAPGEDQLVFERFYRAPRWRESSLPGTGIGLAVCSGLVEAHGGELSAFNGVGSGAVFRFTLPLL